MTVPRLAKNWLEAVHGPVKRCDGGISIIIPSMQNHSLEYTFMRYQCKQESLFSALLIAYEQIACVNIFHCYGF